MADTAVDTTAPAEVTAKVGFIQGFFYGWTVVLKDFVNFLKVVILLVLTIVYASSG